MCGASTIRIGFPLKGSIRATMRAIIRIYHRGLKNYVGFL